jgi:Flp pilus assembly protein protease CpaA
VLEKPYSSLVIFLLLALPISIADLSQRKIPNIYLLLYSYYVGVILVINGVPSSQLIIPVFLILGIFSFCGVGMGDCKLIALIVLMLELSNIQEFEYLLLAILLTALLEIMLRWGYSKVFPRTIAMAPAIFLGTSLYLATSGS